MTKEQLQQQIDQIDTRLTRLNEEIKVERTYVNEEIVRILRGAMHLSPDDTTRAIKVTPYGEYPNICISIDQLDAAGYPVFGAGLFVYYYRDLSENIPGHIAINAGTIGAYFSNEEAQIRRAEDIVAIWRAEANISGFVGALFSEYSVLSQHMSKRSELQEQLAELNQQLCEIKAQEITDSLHVGQCYKTRHSAGIFTITKITPMRVYFERKVGTKGTYTEKHLKKLSDMIQDIAHGYWYLAEEKN